MSYALGLLGFHVAAACDIDVTDRLVYSHLKKHAKMYSSAADMIGAARRRQPSDPRIIVVSGCPCTGLSTAGKLRFEHDPTTRLLFDLIAYACAVGADLIVLENVKELKDTATALYAALLKQAHKDGFTLMNVIRLIDSILGGSTIRTRDLFFLATVFL